MKWALAHKFTGFLQCEKGPVCHIEAISAPVGDIGYNPLFNIKGAPYVYKISSLLVMVSIKIYGQ